MQNRLQIFVQKKCRDAFADDIAEHHAVAFADFRAVVRADEFAETRAERIHIHSINISRLCHKRILKGVF